MCGYAIYLYFSACFDVFKISDASFLIEIIVFIGRWFVKIKIPTISISQYNENIEFLSDNETRSFLLRKKSFS